MLEAKKKSVLILVLSSVFLFNIQPSVAAEKPKGGKKIDVSNDWFTYLNGKPVRCSLFKGAIVTGKRKGVFFILDKFKEKKLKGESKAQSEDVKKKTLSKAAKLKNKRIAKEGACAEAKDLQNNPPAPPSEPLFIEHTIPLTEEDVRRLFHRLAYAPTAAQLSACLGKTAAFCFDNVITVYDPSAHATVYQAASAYFDGDNEPPIDDYLTDGGSINLQGLQRGVAYFLYNTPNQYHAKLALQFLQHHFAIVFATLGTADIDERIAERYIKKLLNHAVNGKVRLMVNDMILDPSLQKFLDGVSSTAVAPGENLPREINELYTIGQKNPLDLKSEGADQYSNLTDIPQYAKALTGWVLGTQVDPDTNRNERTLEFKLANFAPGQKYIFQGKPEAATITTIWDAIEASMNHPSFSLHWARRLIERYGTNEPDAPHILALAQVLLSTDNIHAAIRKIAISKEFFTEWRGAVMRECFDRLFTITRTFKEVSMPVSYIQLQTAMVNCQQEPTNSPQGPFGWLIDRWANSQLLMSNQSEVADRILEPGNVNYSYINVLNPMPAGDRTDPYKVIDYLAKVLNVKLTTAQRDAMYSYMTIQAIAVNPLTDEPTTFSLYPWDTLNETKVKRGIGALIIMMTGSPQFGVK